MEEKYKLTKSILKSPEAEVLGDKETRVNLAAILYNERKYVEALDMILQSKVEPYWKRKKHFLIRAQMKINGCNKLSFPVVWCHSSSSNQNNFFYYISEHQKKGGHFMYLPDLPDLRIDKHVSEGGVLLSSF